MGLFGCGLFKSKNTDKPSDKKGNTVEASTDSIYENPEHVSGEPNDKGQYRVYYDSKDMYTGAEDYFKPGKKVRLVMKIWATDTNYSFYVDGAEFKTSFDEGYVIEFTMPENDVWVSHDSYNSMLPD